MKYYVHYVSYHSEFDCFKKVYDSFKADLNKSSKKKVEDNYLYSSNFNKNVK
jgi:hypothetical protein